MKKLLGFILIITIILAISGCSTAGEKSDKLQIVTTIFPYYSFALEICGDNAEITTLLKPGAESHTYDPTTQDILEIQDSDIFIYTGGESDAWVETVLSSIDTGKTKIIKTIDFIEPIHNENHDHDEAYDEHIWTSLKNSAVIAQKISDTVCEINAESSDFYKQNTSEYIKKLEDLDKEFENTVKSSNKTVIFADRFPFSYLAEDYNLNYISAFPSCSEESEPSVQTMADMINKIKEQNISAVFYIEFSNQKIADTIQSETGANKLLFHSCHNVTKEDFASGVSYLSLMQQNLVNLKEAVK